MKGLCIMKGSVPETVKATADSHSENKVGSLKQTFLYDGERNYRGLGPRVRNLSVVTFFLRILQNSDFEL